jgi:hypothetical protein
VKDECEFALSSIKIQLIYVTISIFRLQLQRQQSQWLQLHPGKFSVAFLDDGPTQSVADVSSFDNASAASATDVGTGTSGGDVVESSNVGIQLYLPSQNPIKLFSS